MDELPGHRAVLTMYLVSVALAGLFGYVLGAVVLPNAAEDAAGAQGSLGPLSFPLDGPSLALYGVVAIGTILGLLLLAVSLTSRREHRSRRGT
jgi:hypothetical protein